MRKTIRSWWFILLDKFIKILKLHNHELIGKIEEHERRKYLVIDDYI